MRTIMCCLLLVLGLTACATADVLAPTPIPIPSGLTGNPVSSNGQWVPSVKEFDGVPMLLVPTGCFRMGSEIGDPDESPMTAACIDVPFWIDRTEVTNAQFARFQGKAALESIWGDPERPRENIRWLEAWNFCRLRGARLPTELEWEYAARGPDSLEYPWGNDWRAEALVQPQNANAETGLVGSRAAGASWVGALDMAGNVWEWTSTLYDGYSYPYRAGDGREDPEDRTDQRVIRGGSWYDITDPFYARTANRGRLGATIQDFNVGFRCVRDQ